MKDTREDLRDNVARGLIAQLRAYKTDIDIEDNAAVSDSAIERAEELMSAIQLNDTFEKLYKMLADRVKNYQTITHAVSKSTFTGTLSVDKVYHAGANKLFEILTQRLGELADGLMKAADENMLAYNKLLSEKDDELEKSKKALQDATETSDKKLSAAQKELTVLEGKLEAKEEEFKAKYEGELQHKDGQIETLRGQVNTQREKLSAQHQKEIDRLNGDVDRLNVLLSSERVDLTENFKTDLQEKKEKIETLQQKLDSQREELDSLAEIKAEKTKFEEQATEANLKITRLEGDLEAARDKTSEMKALETDAIAKGAEVESLQRQLRVLQKRFDDLFSKYEAMSKTAHVNEGKSEALTGVVKTILSSTTVDEKHLLGGLDNGSQVSTLSPTSGAVRRHSGLFTPQLQLDDIVIQYCQRLVTIFAGVNENTDVNDVKCSTFKPRVKYLEKLVDLYFNATDKAEKTKISDLIIDLVCEQDSSSSVLCRSKHEAISFKLKAELGTEFTQIDDQLAYEVKENFKECTVAQALFCLGRDITQAKEDGDDRASLLQAIKTTAGVMNSKLGFAN